MRSPCSLLPLLLLISAVFEVTLSRPLLPITTSQLQQSPLHKSPSSNMSAISSQSSSDHEISPLIVASSIPGSSPTEKPSSIRRLVAAKALSAWGVMFLLSLLGNTIKRLLPIALEPIMNKDLSPSQSVAYVACCLAMTYVEGYKAFHLKFVPLVVARSMSLINHASFLNYLFAGTYSMGLFYSTKKRKIISWSVTTGVFALVMIVKRLPYPWRSIVDAGVVCGLSFGSLSLVGHFIRGLFGFTPDVDPCLPESEEVSAAAKAK